MTDTGPDAEGFTREQELLRENAALRARIAELESRLSSSGVALPPPPPPPPRTAPPTSPPEPRFTPPLAPGAISVEQFIGRRVVPFVGALAVLGAVGYLVNYAIEIGLIGRVPPEARFAMGIVIGVVLLAAGEFVRRRGAPGAATGLDAAGVGAVMVSVALGVFSLQIFGPAAGAWTACAAAALAAAWSVRSGSVISVIVGLIGAFAMPLVGDLAHQDAVSCALLLTFALSTGLSSHIFGRSRFAAARYLSVVAIIVLGGSVLADMANPLVVCGFAILWWGLVAGECGLSALRGVDARANAVIAMVASAALVLLEAAAWPAGFAGFSSVEFLPSAAGGLLFAGALLLRPLAFDPKDDEERASLGQEGIAVGAACGILSSTFAALALALGIGGLVFLVGPSLQGLVLTATACAAAWLGRRSRLLPFDLVALVVGVIGAFVAVFHAIENAAASTSITIPFAPTVDIQLRGSAEIAVLGVSAVLLLAMGSVMRLPVLAGLLVPAIVGAWLAFSARTVDGVLGCAMLVVPAISVAWIPRARLATVIATAVLCMIAGAWWLGRSLDVAWGVGRSGTVELVLVVVPWIAAIVLLARHPALGAARRVTERLSFVAAGGAVAFVAAVEGSHAGFDGIDAGFSVVIALAAVSVVTVLVARVASLPSALDAGLLLAGAMVGTCGFLGFVRLFERDTVDSSGALEFIALASSAAALWIGALLTRGAGQSGSRSAALSAAIAFAVAPFLVLALSAALGRPLVPAAAVGCLVIVGVVELVLGFRKDAAALRWAGLACFGMLVLRLYAVDLADAPMLVRIGLLFVSGMVLVGTGIAYARITRNAR